MEITDKKPRKADKWLMCGTLLPKTARDDLEALVKANRQKFPKGDDRCSISGILRLWVNEHLYHIPPKPEEKKEDKKEVLKLAG